MVEHEENTVRFHQKLRQLATKVFSETETATIASLDNKMFVCIKATSDFPGVAMVQAYESQLRISHFRGVAGVVAIL